MAERTQIESRPVEEDRPWRLAVDYWDRLGWRDRFAKPEFTSRQQRYAAAWAAIRFIPPASSLTGRNGVAGLAATRCRQRRAKLAFSACR